MARPPPTPTPTVSRRRGCKGRCPGFAGAPPDRWGDSGSAFGRRVVAMPSLFQSPVVGARCGGPAIGVTERPGGTPPAQTTHTLADSILLIHGARAIGR